MTQTEIPGTEDPARDPEVDAVLYAWPDAQDEQRRAADTTRIRHATLLAKLRERGHKRYPYLDRSTGKKQYAVPSSDERVKIIKPPQERKPRRTREKREKQDDANTVEQRTVKVADQPDPFAATRAAMEQR